MAVDTPGSWVTPWVMSDSLGHEWLPGVMRDSQGPWGTPRGHEWLPGIMSNSSESWVTPQGHEWLPRVMSDFPGSWVTPQGHEWLPGSHTPGGRLTAGVSDPPGELSVQIWLTDSPSSETLGRLTRWGLRPHVLYSRLTRWGDFEKFE